MSMFCLKLHCRITCCEDKTISCPTSLVICQRFSFSPGEGDDQPIIDLSRYSLDFAETENPKV